MVVDKEVKRTWRNRSLKCIPMLVIAIRLRTQARFYNKEERSSNASELGGMVAEGML